MLLMVYGLSIVQTPDKKPPANWPPEGFMHFDDLSLRYTPDGSYVLHKLQFEVLPREKVGRNLEKVYLVN